MAATWKQSVTTNAGIALMNKAYGVSSIIPTKAVTITDNISSYSVTQIQTLTTVNYNQSRKPIVISNQANTTRIGVDIDNKDVNEQYNYYGIGIYFKQVSTGEEVLFSVIALTDAATIIPNQDGVATSSISIDAYSSIVPGTEIDLTVSDSGSVTRSDVEQIVAANQSYSFPKTPLASGYDLHELLSIGILQIKDDKTVINAPNDFNGNGYVTVVGDGTKSNPITQTLIDTDRNTTFVESYDSDTNSWSGWQKSATENEIPIFELITDNTDLFSLIINDNKPHYYLCSSNLSAKTLKNCPVTTAFSLELYPANTPQSLASNGVAEWAYTQMVLRPFNSSTAWIASTNTDGAGNISNTDWSQLSSVDDISSAIINMADTTKPTNFTDGLKSGGVDVATAADIKRIEDSAWREITNTAFQGSYLFRDNQDGTASIVGSIVFSKPTQKYNGHDDYVIPMPDGYSANSLVSPSINNISNDYIWSVYGVTLRQMQAYFPGSALHLYAKYDSYSITEPAFLNLSHLITKNDSTINTLPLTINVTKTNTSTATN